MDNRALEIAQMINGNEYGDEVSDEVRQLAKEYGVVIVYGQSDDLIELDGAIYDEGDCYDGGLIYLDEQGLFMCVTDESNETFGEREFVCGMNSKNNAEEQSKEKCRTIRAVWRDKETGFDWSYKTDIPHETFEIYDGGEKYCLGICFEKKHLYKSP